LSAKLWPVNQCQHRSYLPPSGVGVGNIWLAIHHYDIPGNFDKNLRFVTMKMSTLKLKGQVGATIYSSHDNTNDKNYSNQNAEKVVGKRITTNRSTNIQMFNQSPLIRLKESSTV